MENLAIEPAAVSAAKCHGGTEVKVCSVCQRCYDDSVAFCTEENHPSLSETQGAPEMIAGYRLERLLESGVKNETYRARQLASGQNCLVRIIYATEYVDDHLREAKLAATLFHPNVVDTYDAGVLESGASYIVHEDPDGRTLREFLSDVGLPELPTSIEIVRQTAEALHALHLGGLVHGAIRPENIVLTSDRERGLFVRIQNPDLGNAVARSAISNKFLADTALDQIKYFSPEQCAGSETSPQTDIYSLGVVFYELLAGSPPFIAPKAVGLIEKHKNHRVPDIRINNYHLQMLVTHSLMETLQKQPRLRQSSANVFARQLRHIEQLATHSSTPPPAGVTPAWQPLPAVPAPASVLPSPGTIDPLPATTAIRAQASNQTGPESGGTEAPEHVATTIEVPLPQPLGTDREPAIFDPPRNEMIDNVELSHHEVEPAVETAVTQPSAMVPVYLDPRSRLKAWKKKLQTIGSNLTPDTPSSPVTSIFASVDREILERREELQRLKTELETKSKTAVPKKVEWETPDDDIPSEAAVFQVLAKEGLPEAPHLSAPERSVESGVADLVESPSIGDPIAVEPVEEKLEARVIETVPEDEPVETQVPVDVPTWNETPGVIETPVVKEEAPAVFAGSAPIETPFEKNTPAPPEETPAIETSRVPETERDPVAIPKAKTSARKKARSAPTSRAAPKVKQPEPALTGSAMNLSRPAAPDARAGAKAPNRRVKRSGLGFPVNLADLEEITIVRPPSKRIRVDWERAVAQSPKPNVVATRPSPPIANDTGFSPTILGGARERKFIDRKRNEEVSSAFASEPGAASPRQYHAIALGAGVVALVGLFLFGFGSVTSYFETSSSADSIPITEKAHQAPALSAPAAVVETALPTKKAEAKDPVRPAAEKKLETKSVAETPAAGSRTNPEKPAVVVKKNDAKTKAEPVKNSKPTAAPTSEKAAKSNSPKTAAAKSPATVPPAKVKEATRPRIVKNAKP
jgi:serine/threonine-protein kinase